MVHQDSWGRWKELAMLHITKAKDVAVTTFHLDGSSLHFAVRACCGPAWRCCGAASSEVLTSKSTEFRTLATFRLSAALADGCLGANSLCHSLSSRFALTCCCSALAVATVVSLLLLLRIQKDALNGLLLPHCASLKLMGDAPSIACPLRAGMALKQGDSQSELTG